MSMQVLVEPLADGAGYRARTGAPLDVVATGPTPDEAIAVLEQAIAERVRQGARIYTVSVPGAPPDLGQILAHAGRPVPAEERRLWREGVDEYRRQCDEELSRRLAGTDPAAGS